jgi:hypothetical protein
MYGVRLVYYLIWHVLQGYVRLPLYRDIADPSHPMYHELRYLDSISTIEGAQYKKRPPNFGRPPRYCKLSGKVGSLTM